MGAQEYHLEAQEYHLEAQEYTEVMGICHNDYEVGLPIIRACKHLSGAAVSTFPLRSFRLPYYNHLSHVVVFILSGGIKDKGWILSYLV